MFSTPALVDGFPQELCDNKSPHVFRTLLSILADLNNAVIFMVSTSPLIFQSSSPQFSCSMVHFLCSSLVHFKNGPEYLTRGTVQVFIFLTRFLL